MQPFDGERTFNLGPDQLWPKLRDMAFLATCIPDASVHQGATRDRAAANVKPGFSFMRGSLDVTAEVIDAKEPTSLKYRLTSKGIGSSSVVETALTLTPHEQGTKIVYRAEVTSLGGLLKMVPSGLIRGAAQQVIEDVWTGVTKKIAAGA
jgi:carbon monoxide dehydrogenase subunit G